MINNFVHIWNINKCSQTKTVECLNFVILVSLWKSLDSISTWLRGYSSALMLQSSNRCFLLYSSSLMLSLKLGSSAISAIYIIGALISILLLVVLSNILRIFLSHLRCRVITRSRSRKWRGGGGPNIFKIPSQLKRGTASLSSSFLSIRIHPG